MKTLKNTIMTAIAAGLAMTAYSCSEEKSVQDEPESGAIRFGAAISRPTRTAPTTTSTIKNFTVYAFTDGKPYMENVKVTRSNGTWTYSPTMYWPTTPVNFFAFSPDITNSPNVGDAGLGEMSFTNHGNIDLLYAVNMNETARESPVNLNFRHALANVRVMLSSGNSAIKVKVGHVKLCNVSLRGTFEFPQATTSASAPDNQGKWSDPGLVSDILTFYAMDESESVVLTGTPADLTENNLNIAYMIPQALTALNYDGSKYTGTAIQVDCEIFDAASGAKIWPTSATPQNQLVPESSYGRLMYPVTTATLQDWKQGYSYVYNIVIDNPAVLHPINFGVTVDEYKDF